MKTAMKFQLVMALALLGAADSSAGTIYNNLTPNNQMAAATRPSGLGVVEIEAADDFVLTTQSSINSASFVGLTVPNPTGGPFSVSNVTVEIYRVFPQDSDTVRTPNVPTRMNSPSDVAFDSRTSGSGLTFSSTVLNPSFTALNSVQPGGINPKPNQTTLGNGPLTGQQIQLNVNFTTPFLLDPNHYFFVPQVTLSNGAQFYWLSASRPIAGAGTTPFSPDLQAWIRDGNLDPDWLRIGTDIVGGTTPPTFDMAFSLDGVSVPEPGTLPLFAVGVAALCARRFRLCRTEAPAPLLPPAP
jgi:hypothetical protein